MNGDKMRLTDMNVSAISILMFAGTLAAQQAAPKPTPPKATAAGSLLFKDAGCVVDYLKAQASSGLEKRKALAELVQYGCVEELKAIYSVFIKSTKSLAISKGAAAVKASELDAILDRKRMERLLGKGSAPDSSELFKHGWVLDADILIEEELDAIIERSISGESIDAFNERRAAEKKSDAINEKLRSERDK
jgi:hypothetical protein